MQGEYIECPECGQQFEGGMSTWIQQLDRHLREEHDIEELHENFINSNDGAQKSWKQAVKATEFLEIKQRESESEEKTKSEESKMSLVDEKIEEEEPVHGVLREKYRGETPTEDQGQDQAELTTPTEVKNNEPENQKGLQDILPSAETAKKWGGRTLILGTLLFAGFAAYKNVNQHRQDANETGEDQAEPSSSSESEGQEEIQANGELENKDNGQSEVESDRYRSYKDL